MVGPEMNLDRLPKPGSNNLWFHDTDADAVLVFVHGVMSDSRSAWLHDDPKDPTMNRYWPKLIRLDDRFENVPMYLAGYHTEVDIGPYPFRDCANEVFDALGRADENGHPPVMAKAKITFVCHSMGGIIVRHLLADHWGEFKDKRVGLVLIASPSYGAKLANTLKYLLGAYNHAQGKQLTWSSPDLMELDWKFKEVVAQKRILQLSGVEFYENRFIYHWKYLPFINRARVVTKDSAVRYFNEPRNIPRSDHVSICKPQSIQDPIHRHLLGFLERNGLLPTVAQTSTPPGPTNGGGRSPLQAAVVALVTVGKNARHPEEQLWLDISLRIECENTTGLPLKMDKPYRLPIHRDTRDCEAWDEKGPLHAKYKNGHVEVDFANRDSGKHPEILAGRPYAWNVNFKTRGVFKVSEDGAILWGPYVISPLDQYNTIPIESHAFAYTFLFKKPKSKWRWAFMENHVIEMHDRDCRSARSKVWDGTYCKFSEFTLRLSPKRRPDETKRKLEKMTIYFTRIYRPRFNLRAAGAFLGGIALGLVIYYAYAHGFLILR